MGRSLVDAVPSPFPTWTFAGYIAIGLLLSEGLFQYARFEPSFQTLFTVAAGGGFLVPRVVSAGMALLVAIAVWIGAGWLFRRHPRSPAALIGLPLILGTLSQVPATSISKAVYVASFALVGSAAFYLHSFILPALAVNKPSQAWWILGAAVGGAITFGGFLASPFAETVLDSFSNSPTALQSAQYNRHVLSIAYYAVGSAVFAWPLLDWAMRHPPRG